MISKLCYEPLVRDTRMTAKNSIRPTSSMTAPNSVPRERSRKFADSSAGERWIRTSGFDLVENDIAVIEITSFNNAAARDRFFALQGLPLSGDDDILVGESGQPPGVSWGFSGAAAIDPAGRVAGVLTGAEFRDRMTLELGSILDAHPNGGAVRSLIYRAQNKRAAVRPLFFSKQDCRYTASASLARSARLRSFSSSSEGSI